jgi:hypothetical protein
MTLRSSTSRLYVHFVSGPKVVLLALSSEMTPKGRKVTKLAQTLLNGNNICMVVHFCLYYTTLALGVDDALLSSWCLGAMGQNKCSQ